MFILFFIYYYRVRILYRELTFVDEMKVVVMVVVVATEREFRHERF